MRAVIQLQRAASGANAPHVCAAVVLLLNFRRCRRRPAFAVCPPVPHCCWLLCCPAWRLVANQVAAAGARGLGHCTRFPHPSGAHLLESQLLQPCHGGAPRATHLWLPPRGHRCVAQAEPACVFSTVRHCQHLFLILLGASRRLAFARGGVPPSAKPAVCQPMRLVSTVPTLSPSAHSAGVLVVASLLAPCAYRHGVPPGGGPLRRRPSVLFPIPCPRCPFSAPPSLRHSVAYCVLAVGSYTYKLTVSTSL